MREASTLFPRAAALAIVMLAAVPVLADDAASNAAAMENPSSLREGLTHYWPFDKKDVHDNKYADLAGNLDLLAEGPARSAAGLFGEALTGEWYSGGDLPPCGKAALTVSAWIMHDGKAGTHCIVTAGDQDCWAFKIVDNHLAFSALGTPDWLCTRAPPRSRPASGRT